MLEVLSISKTWSDVMPPNKIGWVESPGNDSADSGTGYEQAESSEVICGDAMESDAGWVNQRTDRE